MTDEQALLAAILAEPKEDTPRLVYADWLEENAGTACAKCGDSGLNDIGHAAGSIPCAFCDVNRISDGRRERAEFIRVQVELARWAGCIWKTKHVRAGYVDCDQWNHLLGEGRTMTWCPECARHKDLRRRERELWDQYIQGRQEEWFPGWRGWSLAIHRRAVGERQSGLVTRGFISFVALDWSDWRTHAAAIVAVQPVERVRLTTEPLYFHRDLDSDEWIDSLRLAWSHLDDWKQFRRIAANRWPAIDFELPENDGGLTPQEWRDVDEASTRAARRVVRRQPRFTGLGYTADQPLT